MIRAAHVITGFEIRVGEPRCMFNNRLSLANHGNPVWSQRRTGSEGECPLIGDTAQEKDSPVVGPQPKETGLSRSESKSLNKMDSARATKKMIKTRN